MKPTGATKEAMGHSPLPWKLTEEGAGCAICQENNVDSYGIRDAKDQLVCLSEHDSFAPGRSDCEFIIIAVNERERLRDVLQSIVDEIDDAVDRKIRNGRLPPIGALLSTIQDSARAALNEVEG